MFLSGISGKIVVTRRTPRPPARRPRAGENPQLSDALFAALQASPQDPLALAAATNALLEAIPEPLSPSPWEADIEQQLAGKWEVKYTQGPLLWRLYGLLAGIGGGAKSPVEGGDKKQVFFSQEFDPADRTVRNSGILVGPASFWWGKLPSVTIVAEGVYELSSRGRVIAHIKSGKIIIEDQNNATTWRKALPLPIRGSGEFQVVYLDSRLRIFRSQIIGSLSSLAVQVKVE